MHKCGVYSSKEAYQAVYVFVCVCVCVCILISLWLEVHAAIDNLLLWNIWYVMPVQFSSVQSLSHVRLFATPWITAHQASLSITNSQLLESTQTHAPRIDDAIQPSHPLSSPSPPAPNSSQHQGLFQWVNSSHEVAKVLEFQLQHQSFQWIPRTDLL